MTTINLTPAKRTLLDLIAKGEAIPAKTRQSAVLALVTDGLVTEGSPPIATPLGLAMLDATFPLAELASRISAHLRRFEKDPKINPPRPDAGGTHAYYCPGAHAAGAKVAVSYICYQGSGFPMQRAEALAYLRWLDAGNVGTHYKYRSLTNRHHATGEPL
jgi:hypothetical protein